MKNILYQTCIAAFSLFVISSCGTKSDDNLTDENISVESNAIDSAKISAQNVFNSIPPRAEILKLISEAKSEYDYTILSNPDPEVVNKYSMENVRALNLGVYGADLSVAGVYEQTQESMAFLKGVNMLAKQLGVSSAFDEKMVDRMEANKENRDSTLEIVSGSFKKADQFLKANGRPGTSSLIVAGLWIEGYYVALKTAQGTKNENMIKTIFEQKESLKYLIQLLVESKISQDTQYVITDLKSIEDRLNAKTDQVFTIDALKEIFAKTETLRNKIIAVS